MMSYAKLVPELLVGNLDRSLAFWRDLIGFVVVYARPEEGFAYLDLGDAQIMLDQLDEGGDDWLTGPLQRPFGRGLNLQVEVAQLAPVLARLDQAAWPLFVAAQERWYRAGAGVRGQRQALVQDPDGYLLRLAEPLSSDTSRA